MRLSHLLPLALLPASYADQQSEDCKTLSSSVPHSVYSPDTLVYQYEKQNFWSNTEILSPDCVFRPQSGGQLAKGLKQLVESRAPFAVRGGGHMGIKVCLVSGET